MGDGQGGADAPGKPADSGDEAHSSARGRVTLAVAEVRRLIPRGSQGAITAALTTLAGLGDTTALRDVEAHLATATLSVSYGDRDSDPLPWELSHEAFALLARWWRRLGLAGERAAWLASDWLGDLPLAERHFGSNSFEFFTQTAPHIAEHVAPLLIAVCAARDVGRRARAASGLRHTPTDAALDTLAALLGDPVERVAKEARYALGLLAYPPRPGAARPPPTTPDAVAARLLDALGSPSPQARRLALESFAWFAGIQHRSSITLPPQFTRVLPAMARLLGDPDHEVRQVAAKRICAAGHNLNQLRPSREAALGLRLPALDLHAALDDPDPDVVLAALYLAGRPTQDDAATERGALAERIGAMLKGLQGDAFRYPAALYALGRLEARAAIPAIAHHIEQPRELGHIDALLVLGRLRHPPAIAHLVHLLHDLTYQADAREALEVFDAADVLPLVHAQVRASSLSDGRFYRIGPWEVSYLEAHGDAESLALLRQTESYHFAARYCGVVWDQIVAATRRLERRLLLAAGVPEAEIDHPVATVRRILTTPVHPLEHEGRGDTGGAPGHGEWHARWRNLCVAFDGWLLADPPPPLGPALGTAAELLATCPDEVREAHERWWLDVTRGGQIGVPRVSAVARARISERAPWRLARALVVNEGLSQALDPAATLAWPGLMQITALNLEHTGWLQALAGAPAFLAPRVLRVGLYDERAAAALMAWHGLARVERLEIAWDRGLSAMARAGLMGRTLAARRERAWRTPEGTYLVARAFEPVHDSHGGWIVRGDGSVLAVGATYAEMTPAGEVVHVYHGPSRYYAPEETMISAIFEVVGNALHQYLWYEAERPAPGSLDDTVVREGLVETRLAAPGRPRLT